MNKYRFSILISKLEKQIRSFSTRTSANSNGQYSIFPTNTDGWMSRLKNLHGIECSFEIWLDYYSRYNERKLWYGFNSRRKDKIYGLTTKYVKDGGSFIINKNPEIAHNTKIFKLKNKLSEDHFNIPIFELFETKQMYFFGIYESVNDTKNTCTELIERIMGFYRTICENIIDQQNTYLEDYASENRKRVVTHLIRERNQYLSIRRKQLDKYVCAVCEKRMEDIYGDLGKDYAEAHHIIPLNKISIKTRTYIDDLVTVCPNCHKMLHRMKGEASDILRLKIILNKNNHKNHN